MKIKQCVILILCAALAYTLGTLRHHHSSVPAPTTAQTGLATPPWLAAAKPVMRTFTSRLTWMGTVESQASVALTALINGRVEVVTAEDQAPVKTGESVMRLGGFQIEKQRANLQAEIDAAAAQLNLARQTAQRLQDGLSMQLATKDQVAAARATQIKLTSQLDQARLHLQDFERKTQISATMPGVFTRRQVSVGQDVAAGQVVGTIVDPNHLRIVASFFLDSGMEVSGQTVTVDRPGRSPLTGSVQRVLPRAATTGATVVWIEGPDIDRHGRPGEPVWGDVKMASGHRCLAVPLSALVYDEQEQPLVFIRKNDKSYEPCPVQTGLVQDGWVEILSGLKQDQVVVTRGAYELFYRRLNEQFKVQD